MAKETMLCRRAEALAATVVVIMMVVVVVVVVTAMARCDRPLELWELRFAPPGRLC